MRTMIQIVFLGLFIGRVASAQSIDPSYFANADVQRLSPEAFALQPEAKDFLRVNASVSRKERNLFLELINKDFVLVGKIKKFPTLSWDSKVEVLKTVFALEVQALNIKAPELVIDSDRIKGEAFFDFDLDHPGPGTVVLNPKAIQKNSNPYAGLLLLIHETRHSAQFQKSFGSTLLMFEPLAYGYKAAFVAQKELAGKIKSFSDFLTLLNEYDAFSFGNFVVGSLTDWTVDTLGMGTYASQYNLDQTLKIDLGELFDKFDRGEIKDSVLEEFNRLEKVQYDLLNDRRLNRI